MRIRGFTLIEIIISLALVSVIAGLAAFWSRELFASADLESETETLTTLLMQARSHSLANRNGVAHGLCYDADLHAYQSFEKSPQHDMLRTYATRVGKATLVEGVTECEDGGIVFAQLSATTTPTIITLTQGERSISIEVNREGYIDW